MKLFIAIERGWQDYTVKKVLELFTYYGNKFLGEFIAETRRKIKEGIYELI